MSISAVLNTAASGLQVAQTGLRTVSDNVANVNTAGYVRKVVDQTSVSTGGVGQGADVARIRLVADMFLRNASLDAGSRAGEAGAVAEFLDGAQQLFGDPASDTSFFDRLDRMFSAISASAGEPASSVRRSEVLSSVDSFFDQAGQVSQGLQRLRSEADAQIASGVDRVNALLEQIEALNIQISRASAAGGLAAGAENEQIGLVNALSKLIDIKVQARNTGGVLLRTSAGLPLTGDGAAKLEYARTGGSAPETIYGQITVTPNGGLPRPFLDHLSGGELHGLLTARDHDLPALAEQLGEFTARVADELNRAHNASSAVPAPTQLVGRDTGLEIEAALAGFSGKTAVAITDSTGRVTRRVDIDFTAGTMSINGGAASGFTPASFIASLDAALDPVADASFTDRALSLTARGGAGVLVADDPTAPSQRAGRGFAHAFGLNDLVRSDQNSVYETGLRTSDPHGLTAGQTLSLRLTGEQGAPLRDVTVTVPAGQTMADMLAALNAPASGVGLYGGFSLDGQGRLSFTPTTTPPAGVSVLRDNTTRGATGPSLSALFGLDGGSRASRADSFTLRADIAGDGRRLSLARFEASAAVGAIGLSPGDGRGGAALAEAAERSTAFSGGKGFTPLTSSLNGYAAAFGGAVGGRAAVAADARDAAEAIASEADSRRASVEGVNLDEELVLMTTYQQAFSASARLIQAAKDMYDVLLTLN